MAVSVIMSMAGHGRQEKCPPFGGKDQVGRRSPQEELVKKDWLGRWSLGQVDSIKGTLSPITLRWIMGQGHENWGLGAVVGMNWNINDRPSCLLEIS